MPTRPQIHRPAGWKPREGQRAYDRRRGTAAERGYDAAWQRTRAAFLAEHPVCADCAERGRVTVAVDVHHVVKLSVRPDLKHDFDNLMALCKRCHQARTRKGE